MDNKHVMNVKVRDSQNVYFEGSVDRITSFNELGKFDVFPGHANFISILLKQVSLYLKNKKVKEIPIDQAILKVKNDKITIFLGIEALLLDE